MGSRVVCEDRPAGRGRGMRVRGLMLLAAWVFVGSGTHPRRASAEAAGRDRPPNIVLILADDLGAECLNSYGGTSYRTPNLDALARSGVRFTNAFSTPLCSPSRVELMTGRYGFRTGWTRLIEGKDDYLDPRKETTFARVLKAAGYATAVAGKWQLCGFDRHPDHAREIGFDESCLWSWVLDRGKTSRYWDPGVWQDGAERKDVAARYGPDVYREFLIDFMTRHRDGPFFAYYPMALVHGPFEPTPDGAKAPDDRRARRGRGDPAHFADMVAYMDKEVGEIVAALDRGGLLEDTLILFTGDNGTPRQITSMLGETPLPGGKGQMTDAGTRVPLIASWKGTIAPGRVCEDLINFCDVLPTFVDVAGAKRPDGVTIDGRSFAPQLFGKPGTPRDWVFVRLGDRRFVRDRRWKLHGDGRLHDMRADPLERTPQPADAGGDANEARHRLRGVMDRLEEEGAGGPSERRGRRRAAKASEGGKTN